MFLHSHSNAHNNHIFRIDCHLQNWWHSILAQKYHQTLFVFQDPKNKNENLVLLNREKSEKVKKKRNCLIRYKALHEWTQNNADTKYKVSKRNSICFDFPRWIVNIFWSRKEEKLKFTEKQNGLTYCKPSGMRWDDIESKCVLRYWCLDEIQRNIHIHNVNFSLILHNGYSN